MKRPLTAAFFLIALALVLAAAPRGGRQRYILFLEEQPLARQVASRTELTGPIARRAAVRIDAAQRSLKQILADRGFRVTGSVHTVLNAVFVEASPEQLAELNSLPGVVRAAWLPPLKLHLNQAVNLVNVPQAWTAVGGVQNAGTGVKIGILDSGIDQNHPAFQDSSLAMPSGFPKCYNTPTHNDCPFTSNKVIVARSYIDIVANSSIGLPDDFSPRDRIGHGTAVAMIAAGVQNTGPAGAGTTITGVAPKAYLGNYKIYGSPGVNTFSGDAFIQALDDAVMDGMDVVTMSFGAPAVYGPLDKFCGSNSSSYCDAYAPAVENAVASGLAVVVSAGNDGDYGVGPDGDSTIPTLNTIHTPGSAPSAITVGASTNSHMWFSSVRVAANTAPPNLQSIPAMFGDGPKPGGPMPPLPLRDVSQLGNDGFACSGLNSGSLNGAIALIQRSPESCSFLTKVSNAQQAGARGVIIYLEEGDDEIFPPQGLISTTIPTVVIGNTDGKNLKSYVASHSDAPVILDPTLQAINAEFNTVAAFSSHGPDIGTSGIKPELVAVGTDLYTATQKYDPNGDLYDATGYTAASGTSFSAPMVAGAVALVKSQHTNWTPAQLKSAVVNTASSDVTENGQPARVTAVGAGKLDAAAAVKTNVTSDPATLNFGVVTSASLPMKLVLKINNTSGSAVQLSVQGADPDANATLSLNPTSVAAGQTTSVTATLQGRVPNSGSYQGYILVHGGAVDIRVPYLYLVGDGVPFSGFPVAGDGFDGAVSSSNSQLIAFKMVDQYGVPVANAPAVFKSTAGGGSISQGDQTTDILGIAGALMLLGPQMGEQQYTGSITAAGQTLTTQFNGLARVLPSIFTNGMVDAAMGQLGNGLAPGSFASIYGVALADPGTAQGSFTPYLPLALAGVSVSFFGPGTTMYAGRLSYVSPGQINVQIPWELQGFNSVKMYVNIGSISSSAYTLFLSDRLPAIFQYQDSSSQQMMMAVATDALSNAVISGANPAKRGQLLTLWCNGLGPVDQTPPTGEFTPQQLIRTRVTPTVSIGGKSARVDFAGLSPGSIGLYQINVAVPDDASSGIQPIIVNSNGVMSKPANLAIQ